MHININITPYNIKHVVYIFFFVVKNNLIEFIVMHKCTTDYHYSITKF